MLSFNAHATTVTTAADGAGAPDNVFSLTGFTVTGATMASLGLQVEVFFADNTNSGLVNWIANCGTNCGQASGSVSGGGSWTLTQTGDTGAAITDPDTTALNAWTLTNTSSVTAITSVVLLGNFSLVFDRDLHTGGSTGTPGSSFGIDYTKAFESGFTNTGVVTAQYDNKGVVTSASAACLGFGTTENVGCGDIWGKVSFSFATTTFIGAPGNSAVWAFFQDTDTVGA